METRFWQQAKPKRLDAVGDCTFACDYKPSDMLIEEDFFKIRGVKIDFSDGSRATALATLRAATPRSFPSTRWQAFKLQWFPRFLLRRFPVVWTMEMDMKFDFVPGTLEYEEHASEQCVK